MRRSWPIAASSRSPTSGAIGKATTRRRRPETSSRPGSTSTSSSPPERTQLLAEAIVAPLFARLLLRDDVLAALQAHPAANPEIQAACLKLAGTWAESASAVDCNHAAWALVRDPGLPEADLPARPAPGQGRLPARARKWRSFINTLGVAQYRCGLMAEALATLTRSNELEQAETTCRPGLPGSGPTPPGAVRKGPFHPGSTARGDEESERAEDPEAQAFLREAETIELDQVFPANPFLR